MYQSEVYNELYLITDNGLKIADAALLQFLHQMDAVEMMEAMAQKGVMTPMLPMELGDSVSIRKFEHMLNLQTVFRAASFLKLGVITLAPPLPSSTPLPPATSSPLFKKDYVMNFFSKFVLIFFAESWLLIQKLIFSWSNPSKGIKERD